MKIVTLNWGHGSYSISKIVRDIEKELISDEYRFIHVQETGQIWGENVKSLSGWLECRIYYLLAHLSGKQYGTGYIPYLKFRRLLRKERPDIVHIHCPNAFSINIYKTLRYLKENRIPTVITNHAEFFYTGNCSYAEECMGFLEGCKKCMYYKTRLHSYVLNRSNWAWKQMKKSFEGFDNVVMVAVSPWVEERIKLSPITKDLSTVMIMNGIDTTIFRPRTVERYHKKIAVFVSANFTGDINDIKGSNAFIELAGLCMEDDIEFWVVGNNNAQQMELPPNIRILGEIKDQNRLAELYSMADVTVITSKRETYSMVAAESLSCGTPVVAFRNGGTETIAMPEYSRFVDQGDLEGLRIQLLDLIFHGHMGEKENIRCAQLFYSRKTMAKKYGEIYKCLQDRKG